MNQKSDNWDSHWGDFAESASRNPAQRYRHRLILSLLQEADAGRDMRLLDVGSGQGDFIKLASDKWPTASICGFELSQTGVDVTRKKVPHAEAHVVNVFTPSAEANRFNRWATHAVCSEVLEHVDDPTQFLKCASRYLAPSAYLIVTVPGGPMSAYDRHIGHRQHFTTELLNFHLEESGFKPVHLLQAGFPFFNLYRMTVIARGERLIQDATHNGITADIAMLMFRCLFLLNFRNSIFGWQMVAVARYMP